jgi:hypothetical protein
VGITTDGPGGSSVEDPGWMAETALHYADGRSVDSRQVPLVALPRKNISGDKVQLGDYAVVFDKSTGRQAFAIVADIAPSRNQMDLSVALANLLGFHFNLKAGAIATDKIVCLAFPASGNRQCPESIATINEQGAKLFDAWGGVPEMQRHLKPKE